MLDGFKLKKFTIVSKKYHNVKINFISVLFKKEEEEKRYEK